ncbi:MAG: [FeFe] hydrogenase H-cluster radical SAM maturase HydG [Deltaproteobacteria bacterium]|nr:[FeFe] hydrogenase H-cluster radical SAM maturase HydG [Deltaproteobacteria bacterium]
MSLAQIHQWSKTRVQETEVDKYLINGRDFIDGCAIEQVLENACNPDRAWIRDILEKSLAIERLTLEETALLANVTDPDVLNEMADTGLKVKRKVYDNRIVFFAPLYCSNCCINGCVYCGFNSGNTVERRRTLTRPEIIEETKQVLAEGHKRMIVVFGEHPSSDVNYICNALNAIYSVHRKTPQKTATSIRRINVNAAPMCISDLQKLHREGIGTFQVFQETYHKETYRQMHPFGPKANYRWRLYALHRAMEAGVDDVGAGALLGLHDWKYEVLGLVAHAMDLERAFNIGPHTVSVPRLTPASGSSTYIDSRYLVNDKLFKRMITVIRLAIPYTGLIVTAREKPGIHMQAITLGCTQTDASSKIGVGAYAAQSEQHIDHQQFMLGDTRTLDEVIHELAKMGMITSFCTAGYRCGRTGDKIMKLLHSGTEGKFCKLNAVLTFREYLDDYASAQTRAAGEKIIEQELAQIEQMDFYNKGALRKQFNKYYSDICAGQRDVYV